MIDIRLRFADEAAYEAAFLILGWPTRGREGDLLAFPRGDGWDGAAGIPVVATPGTFDPIAGISTPPVLAPGYHVDVRLLSGGAPEPLWPFMVAPSTPAHTFF